MAELKVKTWIKAGYQLLGTEGIDGLKIERLARILKLNKSGFYHYFGTLESYVKMLIHHHVQIANLVASEISSCENIDPDLLRLIVKQKAFFLVESQLVVKSRPALVGMDIDEAGDVINKKLLPLWSKVTDLPRDNDVALAYLNIIRHYFYARIDPQNIGYDFIHTLAVDTKAVLDKVAMEKHLASQSLGESPG
jgi:AcrR family transcriptional regulator